MAVWIFRLPHRQPWRTELKTVIFDSRQLAESSASQSISLPWTAFTSFRQDNRYFYLRTPDGAVFWLPQIAFNEIQSALFIKYAQRRND